MNNDGTTDSAENGTDDFRVMHLEANGPLVSTSDDTSDLIGNAWINHVSLIAIPVARLDPLFFDLSSLLAGEITQKLVNYQVKLAVIGDISEFLAASTALGDFVWESNRGEHVWFLPNETALETKLAASRGR